MSTFLVVAVKIVMKSCAAAAASLMRADKTSGSIVFAAELPDVSQCPRVPPEFSARATKRPISAYFPSAERFVFSAAAPSRLLDSADSFLSGFGGRVSA